MKNVQPEFKIVVLNKKLGKRIFSSWVREIWIN